MPGRSSELLLAAYEKLYYFELDRKEKLFARFPILLALYSILLGTLASYLSNLPSGPLYLLVVFYSAAVGQIGFTIWSVCYTYRFLYSDDYDYILPNPPDEVPLTPEGSTDETPEGSIDDVGGSEVDVTQSLIDKYRDSILQNFELNKSRNADFFKATSYIIIALVFAFVGAFPYFTLRKESLSKDQKVVIDSVLRVKVMPDTTNQKPQQTVPMPTKESPASHNVKRDATGLGVYRLRDRHTSAESKRNGEWVRRK